MQMTSATIRPSARAPKEPHRASGVQISRQGTKAGTRLLFQTWDLKGDQWERALSIFSNFELLC